MGDLIVINDVLFQPENCELSINKVCVCCEEEFDQPLIFTDEQNDFYCKECADELEKAYYKLQEIIKRKKSVKKLRRIRTAHGKKIYNNVIQIGGRTK